MLKAKSVVYETLALNHDGRKLNSSLIIHTVEYTIKKLAPHLYSFTRRIRSFLAIFFIPQYFRKNKY